MANPADVKQRSWRRFRQWPTWAKWLAGLVAVWWVAGWTLPISGRVVDESSGKPIAGAYVVRYWNAFGMNLAGGRPSCIAFRVAETDEAGRYFITPAWSGVSIRRDPLLQAMRNGIMVYAEGKSLSKLDPGWPETIFVKAAPNGGEARIEELGRFFILNTCGSDQERKRKALDLYKALYTEAVQVAPYLQQETTEASFRMQVEVLEIGWEEAADRRSRGDRTPYR